VISKDKPEPVIQRYWDIPYDDSLPVKSIKEYFEEFERLFLDAVRLQLIADVPVGVLLSGGLDSSSVAAAIAEIHNNRLDSFSIAFRDAPAINELPFAKQVAEQVRTNHHEIVIGQGEFWDFLPKFVRYADEPLADLASVPLYYVSSLAREKVKVVLSGEGSDEILGGYNLDATLRGWDRITQFQRLPTWLRRGTAPWIAQLFGAQMKERFQKANLPLGQRLLFYPPSMTNYFTSDQKQILFKEMPPTVESFETLRVEIRRAHTQNPLHQLLYLYCQSWLVEDLLMKADKMTMANSIELRVPFLDHRLVEWAACTPPWVKVGRNSQGRYETKRALRYFARTRLPAVILSREKQGFPVPVYDWLSNNLKMKAFDLLASRDTYLSHWLNPEPVQKQLQLGTEPGGALIEKNRLWNLLILELWMREWKPR
jgi:asparagine synthase (glutamine-hydrolysing)